MFCKVTHSKFAASLLKSTSSVQRMSTWNKPRNSSDKGPEKNYRKKLLKEANKDGESTFNTARTLIEALDGDVSSEKGNAAHDSMRKIISGIKAKLSVPVKRDDYSEDDRVSYKTMQTMKPMSFMKSEQRLGIFQPLSPDDEVMPVRCTSLAEKDKKKRLNEIYVLQTTSYFDDIMAGKGIPYPRQFPIDNENYEHGETDVSFKDHVLLDHLLKDFPARGPVRHFMELVATGLSMNPGYTVEEKRDFMNWYAEYFAQFSPEELQTLPPNVIPKQKQDFK